MPKPRAQQPSAQRTGVQQPGAQQPGAHHLRAPGGRVRIPAPLISRRLPSGRGATEQPNATGDGDAALTPMFWLMVVATGVAAGLFGDLMMLILFSVQHLAFGYHTGSLEAAVERASDVRRLVVLLIAGAFGGVGWFLLRRYTAGEKSELDDVVWGEGAPAVVPAVAWHLADLRDRHRDGRVDRPGERAQADGRRLSERAGGLGRAVPGAAPAADGLRRWRGAGRGIQRPARRGAVHRRDHDGQRSACRWSCPRWPAHGSPRPPPGCTCPTAPTYLDVPSYRFTMPLLVWALLAGPLIGLVASGYIRLIGWVSHHQATRPGRAGRAGHRVRRCSASSASPTRSCSATARTWRTTRSSAPTGSRLLLALFALKPLVTALCLGSGASGGLFTPTLSTGAVLGGAAGLAWSLAWPGSRPAPMRWSAPRR